MDKSFGYSDGALAAVSSNLAKAAEKQMRATTASEFTELATYFDKQEAKRSAESLSQLLPLITWDLEQGYTEIERSARDAHDRGALRCMTWGKKVTAIHKSILGRYEKQKDALLESSDLFVCEACGFIAIAKQVPELCPICKAPSSRFVKIA